MATKTKRLRILNEAYATLPPIPCKGLCWESCASICVTEVEVLNIEEATGQRVETIQVPFSADADRTHMLAPTSAGTCPHLQLRRCSIHTARPLICRVFGVAEGLRCPHGCVPERVIPDAAVERLIQQLTKL